MNIRIRVMTTAAILSASMACGRENGGYKVSSTLGPRVGSSGGSGIDGGSNPIASGGVDSGSNSPGPGTPSPAPSSPDGGAVAIAQECTTDNSDPALPKVTAQFNSACADLAFREPGCHVSQNACISGDVAFAAPASGKGTVPLGSWDSSPGGPPYTDWWINYAPTSAPTGILIGGTVWGTDSGFVSEMWDLSSPHHLLYFYDSNGTRLQTIIADGAYFVRQDGVVVAHVNSTASGYDLLLNYYSADGQLLSSSLVDSVSAPIARLAVAQSPTRHVILMYLVESTSASAPAAMMARWFDGVGKPLTGALKTNVSSCGGAFPILQPMISGDVALAVMTTPNGQWTYCTVLSSNSPHQAPPPDWLAQESNLFQMVRGDTMYSFSSVTRGTEDLRLLRSDGVECARYTFTNVDTDYSGVQIGVDGTVDSLEASNQCRAVWWPGLLGR